MSGSYSIIVPETDLRYILVWSLVETRRLFLLGFSQDYFVQYAVHVQAEVNLVSSNCLCTELISFQSYYLYDSDTKQYVMPLCIIAGPFS